MKQPKLTTKRQGILVFYDYKKTRYKFVYAFLLLILFIALFFTVFPPIWLFLSSFKTAQELYAVPFSLFPESFDLGKISDVWNMLQFGRYFVNSLIVVMGAIVAAVLFNGLLAYVISVLKPVGGKLVFATVLASLMIPPILNMGPLFQNLVRFNLINTYIPLWLVFGANPFFFIMFKTYFDRLPKELFEAAQIDGANNLQMFLKIVLPLSKPIVGVITIFTLNAAWSDFLLPFLVLLQDDKQTVMVKIFKLQSTMGTSIGFGPDMLLMVLAISIIPPIILFILFQRQITSSVATTGIK
jgi:multiple sugar transport system permease protein